MAGPEQTVEQLTLALNQGDLDAAVALYEENAVLVGRPGQVARGRSQIRQALQDFVALHPTLTTTATQVTESGDLALYMSRWSLRGTDPSGASVTMGGESTDILRRQSDGRWLIALDNPWGVAVLSEAG